MVHCSPRSRRRTDRSGGRRLNISYIWTERDNSDLLGQTTASVGFTPYGLLREQVPGTPSVGSKVPLSLPGRAFPYRSHRFSAVKACELSWRPIGVDARHAAIAAASTVGALMAALHAHNAKKYPALFYEVDWQKAQDTVSGVYPLITTSRHAALLMDYWRNSRQRAALLLSGRFSWSDYHPGPDHAHWQRIANLPVPSDKSLLWVPLRVPRRRRVGAAGNHTTVLSEQRARRVIHMWCVRIRGLIRQLDLHVSNVYEESRRRAHPYGILEHYNTALTLTREGLENQCDRQTEEARTALRKVMAGLDDWQVTAGFETADRRVARGLGALKHTLTNDATVAAAFKEYLPTRERVTNLAARALKWARYGINVLAAFSHAIEVDAGQLVAAHHAAVNAAEEGNKLDVGAVKGDNPVLVLAHYQPDGFWSGELAQAIKKGGGRFKRVAKIGRRLSQLGISFAGLAAGRNFIKALKKSEVGASEFLVARHKMNVALTDGGFALNGKQFAYIKKIYGADSLISKVAEDLSDSALPHARQMRHIAGEVGHLQLGHWMKEVEKLEQMELLLLNTTGAGGDDLAKLKALKTLGESYDKELKALTKAATGRHPSVSLLAKVEHGLFFVSSTVSFVINAATFSSEIESEDPLLRIAGWSRGAKALVEGYQIIERWRQLKGARWLHFVQVQSLKSGVRGLLGGAGVRAIKAVPIISYALSGVLDLAQGLHYWDINRTKAIGYFMSAAGNGLVVMSLIWTGAGILGPIGWVLIIGGSVVVIVAEVMEGWNLTAYSEVLQKRLTAANEDGGFIFTQYATPQMKADFEEIHRQFSALPKALNSQDNRQLLHERGVPDSLWYLMLGGYPPPADGKFDTTTPASQRGPGYGKYGGTWEG